CVWPFTLDSGYELSAFGLHVPLLLNGFLVLLLIRFLFGMGEAGAYPNIARSFHNWFPFQERGSAQGAVWMAGRFAGGVTTLVVMALLIHTPTASGTTVTHWRHTFWLFGVIGVVWCVVFWWWFRDRPEQKPGVNRAEIDLILGRTDPVEGALRAAEPEPSHAGVPWRRLLTSGNLWVLCLMYF